MRKPCGVLITACTGLPSKITLGNEKSFLPAGCQQEQQSPPCSKMQHLLSHIPRVHQETHPHTFSLLQHEEKGLTELQIKALPAAEDGNLPSQTGDSQIFSFPAFLITFLSKDLFARVESLQVFAPICLY